MLSRNWSLLIGSILALAILSPAHARDPVETFDYNFDDEGELHGFSCEASGEAAWRAGGVKGSAGCIEVKGDKAVLESSIAPFLTGEATLSFYYYAHGYDAMRFRLNVWPGEAVERFGLFSHNMFRHIEQDKWVLVKLKLKDLVGSNPDKPLAYPELVWKRIAVFPLESSGPGSFLLLDDIRLTPAVQEAEPSSNAPRQRSGESVERDQLTLLDFERPAQVEAILTGGPKDQTMVAVAESGVAKLTVSKGHKWATLSLDSSALQGWAGYDFLVFDLNSHSDAFIPLSVELWDDQTTSYPTRVTYGTQTGLDLPPIHEGPNTVMIDLRRARRNGKEGIPFTSLGPGDRLNLSRLTQAKIWFDTRALEQDVVIHLDNLRLMQEGALDTNIHVQLPDQSIAIDFGDETPIVDGFVAAGLNDVWDDSVAFGFAESHGLSGQGGSWPDPLTGDYVGPIPKPDARTPPDECGFDFRVRVPNGRYLVWVAGGGFIWPDRDMSLSVNGKELYSSTMTPGRFYSTQGLFRFLNTLYSEKPHAVWQNYVQHAYPAYSVESQVSNGEISLKGVNSFLSALVITSIDEKMAFDDYVNSIQEERTRFFEKDIHAVRPANEPTRKSDPELLIFSAADSKQMMPWSGFDARDDEIVRRGGAPGEKIAFQVGVRPFQDFDEATFTLTDLAGPGGSTIPAEAASIHLKRYISNGKKVMPWVLLPTQSVPLEKNLTRSFWVRLAIPMQAEAGTYKGSIHVTAGAIKRALPVELEVYPIRLAGDIPLSIGCFYKTPDQGQFALFDHVENFASQRKELLRQQFAIMKDHGMTSVELPGPLVRGFDGGRANVDFSGIEESFEAARDAGLFTNPLQKPFTYMLTPARSLARHLKIEGIGNEVQSEAWRSGYVSMVEQTVEWSKAAKAELVLWIIDEPRESPNPWNRNLADTIEHAKLAGQVSDAVRMITPMGDVNRGKDYTVLADHFEIVDTHAGKSSEKLINRGMTDPNVELWIYNVGGDRLSNGLYLWRVGATGKHEWHFNQWTRLEHDGYPALEPHNPFCEFEGTAFTVPAPLEYPGALLPTEKMLTMSLGINDYRYIHTLNEAIAECKANNTNLAKVAEAEAYLEELKELIPVLPKVNGLKQLDQVGTGLDSEVDPESARRKIAAYIVSLQNN